MTAPTPRPPPPVPFEERLRRRTLAERAVLGAVLLAFAVLVGLEAWSSRRALEATERDRLEHQAAIVRQNLVPALQAVVSGLESVRADLPALRARGDEAVSERMQMLATYVPGLRSLLLVDASGRVVASNRPALVGQDLSGGERYRAISANPDPETLHVSPPFQTPLGVWALSLGKGVLGGRPVRRYVLAIIEPEFWERLLASTQYEPDVAAVMIHSGGRIIHRMPDPAGAIGSDLSGRPESGFARHLRSGRPRTIQETAFTSSGRDALMVFQDIRPAENLTGGWLVAAFAREREAVLAPWRAGLARRTGMLVLLGLASSFGLVLFQRHRAEAAKRELASAAQRREADEERRRNEALRASESLLKGILETSPTGFAVLRGRELRYELVSPAYQAIGPGKVMRGRSYAECWPEVAAEVVPIVLRVLDTGMPFHAENVRYAIARAGVTEDAFFSFHIQRLPTTADEEPAVLVTAEETTRKVRTSAERATLQARLELESRLAGLGTLAAGMAHEINNPLTALTAGLGMVIEEARDDRTDGERLRILQEAMGGAMRIAEIVKDMAAFARPGSPRAPCRLPDVVAEAVRWMPPNIRALATVTVEDRGAPEVTVARGQMLQVVMNLVTNAAKATPPGKRGEVRVRVGPGAAGMASLEVIDRGVGIPPENLARIFDPFFTTRPSGEGRGTGLGLAICHSIVTSYGGTITVSSTPGQGSTFTVELPVA